LSRDKFLPKNKEKKERETRQCGEKQWRQQLFAPINGCLGHNASPGTHRQAHGNMAHKLAYLNIRMMDTAPQIGLSTFYMLSRFKRATFISLIIFFFCASDDARL